MGSCVGRVYGQVLVRADWVADTGVRSERGHCCQTPALALPSHLELDPSDFILHLLCVCTSSVVSHLIHSSVCNTSTSTSSASSRLTRRITCCTAHHIAHLVHPSITSWPTAASSSSIAASPLCLRSATPVPCRAAKRAISRLVRKHVMSFRCNLTLQEPLSSTHRRSQDTRTTPPRPQSLPYRYLSLTCLQHVSYCA